jgi:hypothetical protein
MDQAHATHLSQTNSHEINKTNPKTQTTKKRDDDERPPLPPIDPTQIKNETGNQSRTADHT